MRLYLQFGYGMMQHCLQLIEGWGGGTVVLSPRDLEPPQLTTFSEQVRALDNGRVLFDPQFYVPHSDHERLCSHDFWPANYDTGAFWSGPGLTRLIQSVFRCNQEYGCRHAILPGMMATDVDDDWLATMDAVIEAAQQQSSSLPLIPTIALGVDALRDSEQIDLLLEHSEGWDVHGYYVLFEHPSQQYMVPDNDWMTNGLNLLASLRLRGAKVILGYSNQQLLIAALAKTHAICSGTWLNVRAFSLDKFSAPDEDDVKRRSKWYYCPQSLSEYKIPVLDRAQEARLLRHMATPANLDGGYAAPLFSGAQPTSVGWPDQSAFRHYLHALRGQADELTKATFNDTVTAYSQLLTTAEALMDRLSNAGIDGDVRDFAPMLETNRAAVASLVASQGPLLRRRWAQL